MKPGAALLLCLLAAAPARAAYEEEGFSEAPASTDTVRASEEEEGGAYVQESDEDLAEFVLDYIRRDTALKNGFLVEEPGGGKLLRLSLMKADRLAKIGRGGSARTVGAQFRDAAGALYDLTFHLQAGPWGGLDIYRIEIRRAGPESKKPAKPAEKVKP
jgi:hypothetical protein